MTADDLTLATQFDAEAHFENTRENRPVIEEFRGRLLARDLVPGVRVDNEQLVISYRLSIADALAIGYNEAVVDELRFALEDAFPELKHQPESVARRIRELEYLWGIRRRKAS